MPIPAPVNYQIVPIRHSNSFYRTPTRSLQSLNTFGNFRAIDDNYNSNSRNGTLRNHNDERKSPYYYNELTQMHGINQQQQQFTNHIIDDNFTDFINTIHYTETNS